MSPGGRDAGTLEAAHQGPKRPSDHADNEEHRCAEAHVVAGPAVAENAGKFASMVPAHLRRNAPVLRRRCLRDRVWPSSCATHATQCYSRTTQRQSAIVRGRRWARAPTGRAEDRAPRWCNDDEVHSPRVQTGGVPSAALAHLAVLVQHSRVVNGATYVPPPGCEENRAEVAASRIRGRVHSWCRRRTPLPQDSGYHHCA